MIIIHNVQSRLLVEHLTLPLPLHHALLKFRFERIWNYHADDQPNELKEASRALKS